MKRINLCLSIALAIGICSCNNSSELIALSDCPQKMDGFSVELSQNEDYVQTIKITKDGKMLQELKGEGDDIFFQGSSMAFKNSMVYYVDANYDGDIDIYIGTGEDRSYNTLLLWNSDKKQFERYGKIGEPSLMAPYFSPSEKAIYECGSGGVFDFGYSKLIWEKGMLVKKESLNEILFREGFDFDSYNEFNDYKRSKKYAILDSNSKPVLETNSIDELPNRWAEIVTKERASWGENTDDFPTLEKLQEYEASNMEENIKKQIVEMINEDNGWEVLSGPSSVWNLQKVSEGMYKAEFMTETEYEKMDYEIQDIEVDENGKVLGLKPKRVNIRPKANKPDGGIKTVEEIVDRQIGRIR